jgi:hypothetical protein
MGKSNKGLLLVVGGGIVLAVGFAALYFLVLAPRAEKKHAQEEVSAWAKRWDAARDCLVGPDPRSSDGHEAVLLREALATGDVVDELRECAEEVRVLRRAAGYNAGAEIEAAWTELEKAIDRIVEAHALRTAKTPDRSAPELRVMLGQAVAAVDLSYARMRERADMGADHPDGHPLPTLSAGRVVADAKGTPIAPTDVGVSGNVVWAIGTVGDRSWLVRHATSTPEVIPLGVETIAALDGGGWGLWLEPADEGQPRAEIRAGALDALGDPAGDGALVQALAPGETGTVQAALGRGATRVAFYQTTGAKDGASTTWMARSRDAGATWTERTVLVVGDRADAEIDLGAQRLDLRWHTASGAPAWLVVDPATIDGPLTPAAVEAPPGTPCVAGPRTWWVSEEDQLLVSDAPGAAPVAVPGSDDIGRAQSCAGDRLIALRASYGVLADPTAFFCRPAGCVSATIPSAALSQAAALIGEKRGPVVAVDTDGVVVVWTGDPDKKQAVTPSTIVRLAGEQRLAGIVEWSGALQLVTRTEAALHIVPLGGR